LQSLIGQVAWAIPEPVLQIIAASIAATISGSILLLIHHSKVKQELEIQRKKEQFEKKQLAYRSIIREVNALWDFSATLGRTTNWRINREIYQGFLIVASKPVIIAYNTLMRNFDTPDNQQLTKLLKDMVIAMRHDLYDDALTPDQIRFIEMPKGTIAALEKYGSHREKLEQLGIKNLDDLAMMKVEEVYQKTGISIPDLKQLHEVGMKESRLLKEVDDYLAFKK
jgi:hypothetical protein